MRTFTLKSGLLAAAVTSALATGFALADDAATLNTEARRTDTLTAAQGDTRVQTRLASQFSAFAGSQENAQSLATGLRHGTPVTLTSTSSAGQTSSLTFDPPTRPMGNGNVFISLALAKQQLANLGITQPTPEQLKAALVGGTVTTGSGATAQTTTLKGVLALRAEGMGWGRIAKSQGMNLGQVVSGLKRANHSAAASGSVPASGEGIVTASGERVRLRHEHRVRGREVEDADHRRFERREEFRERLREGGLERRVEQRIELRERGGHGAQRFEQRSEQRLVVGTRNAAGPAQSGIVTATGAPLAASGTVRFEHERSHGHGRGNAAAAVTASGSATGSGIVTAGGTTAGAKAHGGGRGRGRDH